MKGKYKMKLENLSWNEIDTENSAVIVGLAPIEEHGHHLPIGVDFYLTQKWVESTAEALNKNDPSRKYYTLPIIPLGNADIKTFPGNLHLKQHIIYHIIKQILQNICDWGIKNIIVISGHGDPKHQIAIEQACSYINRKNGLTAFSPMGAIFSQEKAGIDLNHSKIVKDMLDKYPNDFHAGWIETSLMLYYKSKAVRENYLHTADIDIAPQEMISRKKIDNKMADIGHLGYPRLASKELGEALHINMVENIVLAIEKFINKDDYSRYQHHFLYKIPFLRVGLFRR